MHALNADEEQNQGTKRKNRAQRFDATDERDALKRLRATAFEIPLSYCSH